MEGTIYGKGMLIGLVVTVIMILRMMTGTSPKRISGFSFDELCGNLLIIQQSVDASMLIRLRHVKKTLKIHSMTCDGN